MRYKAGLAAITLMAASSYVFPQAEVVDRPIGSSRPHIAESPAPSNQVSSTSQSQADLHYQLQLLQEEVLQLRGQVEEQSHELKKLKQQRLDDYLDLDRRISELSRNGAGAGTVGSMPSGGGAPTVSSDTPADGTPAPEDELQSYRTAMEYIFTEEKRSYSKAIEALSQHLAQYPRGRYAANAQYWLGEIYLKENDLEKARQWFAQLLQDFPSHSKAPDAKFKLGKVYDMLGDKAQAKRLLEEVAQSGSNAAKLAQEYLDIHFQS